MTSKQILQALGTFVGITGFIVVGTLASAPHLQADDHQKAGYDRDDRDRDGYDRDDHDRDGYDRDDHDRDNYDPRVERGLDIAPVQLTYSHRNRRLVGLGSYIVNTAGCNGCHSAGPATEYAPGGNPFFLPGNPPPRFNGTKAVNSATYLGGGRDFGVIGGVDIVSRNMTPDKSGLPEGGASFNEFYNSMRHGIDADALHPMMAFPFDGSKLQVMPWPNFQDWTDEDLKAVYAYLGAVPCIAGTPTPGTGNPATRDLTTHLCS